ncbi:MAG: trimeric intracellular cation channel family protein [Armatimonadetes bacterium]|nr:trimeric intracellular cation channel family protein [Armatimonadota bacterium]
MLLLILDYLGTFAFAVSGALKGVRKGMDLFGVSVLALVTAIGGGTLRDALLDVRPFWLGDQVYVLISLVAAGAVFVLYRLFARTERSLLVFDAVGLGVFTAIGAMKAQAADAGGLGMVTMAVMTGVGGGMMRDVLAGDIPVVLREEIYASASIAGALVLWGALALGLPETVAICAGAGLTVLTRILSILLKWKLPRRDPDSCREQ